LIAAILCDQTPGLTEEARLDRRIQTIKTMVKFCRVREAPRQKRSMPSRDWGVVEVETEVEGAFQNHASLKVDGEMDDG